jgi:hypothetical protein
MHLRDSSRRTALDPIKHVSRVKATAAHAELLRREQSAQIRAPDCFLVTTGNSATSKAVSSLFGNVPTLAAAATEI